jgi:hypothetical protein
MTQFMTLPVCNLSTCADATTKGCSLTFDFDSLAWNLAAAGTSGVNSLSLTGTIAGVTGTVQASNCYYTVSLPTAGVPFSATGANSPNSGTSGVSSVSFQAVDLTLGTSAQLLKTAASTSTSCTNQPLALFETQLEAALLDALKTRAAELSCLACRNGACDEGIACM